MALFCPFLTAGCGTCVSRARGEFAGSPAGTVRHGDVGMDVKLRTHRLSVQTAHHAANVARVDRNRGNLEGFRESIRM